MQADIKNGRTKKIALASLKVLLLSIALLGFSCTKNESPTEPSSKYDNAKLESAYAEARQIDNLKCLIVSQNDTIIKEEYFKAGTANSPHDVRSVTKSVIGILVGIAIDKGLIQSTNRHISQFISPIAPNLPTDKAGIKISHLLTMSGGFQWEELISVSSYNNWVTASNQVDYLLQLPLSSTPGETFTYNSAALHLLSVIITQASNMSTKDFAKQYLFEPLGIADVNWQTDHQGYYNGGAGLQITPHDMLKIGSLILNKGVYKGKQIVSSLWITQLTKSQISTNNAVPFGSNYGYCWWVGQSSKGAIVFANGWGGQFIVVVPSINVVVVATSIWSGVPISTANDQWYRTLTIIITKILESFN